MHRSKPKMTIVALLSLLLIAGCGDGDDNNGTNNGAPTNNGTPTNNATDAGDTSDDDNDTDTEPDATGGSDLPSSFVDSAEQARTASQSYFTTYCDCYTDTIYGGDRAACESTFEASTDADPAQASQCEIDVYTQYEDEFLVWYDCLNQEMTEANTCLSSCPPVSELSTCTEGVQSCTLPQEVSDALEACQDAG